MNPDPAEIMAQQIVFNENIKQAQFAVGTMVVAYGSGALTFVMLSPHVPVPAKSAALGGLSNLALQTFSNANHDRPLFDYSYSQVAVATAFSGAGYGAISNVTRAYSGARTVIAAGSANAAANLSPVAQTSMAIQGGAQVTIAATAQASSMLLSSAAGAIESHISQDAAVEQSSVLPATPSAAIPSLPPVVFHPPGSPNVPPQSFFPSNPFFPNTSAAPVRSSSFNGPVEPGVVTMSPFVTTVSRVGGGQEEGLVVVNIISRPNTPYVSGRERFDNFAFGDITSRHMAAVQNPAGASLQAMVNAGHMSSAQMQAYLEGLKAKQKAEEEGGR